MHVLAGFATAGLEAVAALAGPSAAWVVVTSAVAATAGQIWSLVCVVMAGLRLLAVARRILRAPWLTPRRESSAD